MARLAAYVDEKIRAAAETTPTGDSLRLAVLAALNIADELFRCRDATRTATAPSPSAPASSNGCSTASCMPRRARQDQFRHSSAACTGDLCTLNPIPPRD